MLGNLGSNPRSKNGGKMIHKNWQELIKPSSLSTKDVKDTPNKAIVVAEPLERGFGLTSDSDNLGTDQSYLCFASV